MDVVCVHVSVCVTVQSTDKHTPCTQVNQGRTLEVGGPSTSQKLDQLQPGPPQPPKEISATTVMEFDFVEHPSEEFFCPVTTELLLEPYLTICCGNHLSQRAVSRLKEEKKPCPICKEPELATVLDKFHRRKVREVKVRCPHTPSGCEWVGEVGELNRHTETCLQRHVSHPDLDEFKVVT